MRSIKQKQVIPQHQIRDSPDSVLIPGCFIHFYLARCLSFGSRRAYFDFVAMQFLPLYDLYRGRLMAGQDPRWKTKYQESGQGLEKFSFLATALFWENFRVVAAASGVSICFLFAFLVRLDFEGFFEKHLEKTERDRNSYPPSKHNTNLEIINCNLVVKINGNRSSRLRQLLMKRRRRKPG